MAKRLTDNRERGSQGAAASFNTTVLFDFDVLEQLDGVVERRRRARGRPAKDINRSVVINEVLRAALTDPNALSIRVPLVGRAAAGPATLAEENIEDYVSVPERFSRGACFALTVRGDSMEPTLRDGDVVLVKPAAEATERQIVVAMFDDPDQQMEPEGVVKRFSAAGGIKTLLSDNPDFEPIHLPSINVIGVVVGAIHQF